MAKTAQTFADVVLGEAVSGTRFQRYEDMKAIASAALNRANALGVSVDDVISAKGQFDAFGKALPPGVEAFRSLAEQAIAEVVTQGPTHTGMFYATPSAVKSLPSGLQPVTQTAGHLFFDDPKNRSIATAAGYRVPNKANTVAPQQTKGLFDRLAAPIGDLANATTSALGNAFSRFSPANLGLAPAPTSRPSGMAALAPNGLFDLAPRDQPGLSYSMGPNRPNPPSSNVVGIVRDAVNDVLGPGFTVDVISGMEDPGQQYGSNRHRTGLAADVQIKDISGRTLNAFRDQQALMDVAQAAAAKGATGIGIGQNYMNARGMHVDLTQPGPGQSHTWGNLGVANRGKLIEAMQYSLMPESFYSANLPSQMSPPTSRASALAQPSEMARQQTARTQLGQSLAQAGVSLGGKRTATAPSVEQANANRFDKMTAAPQGQRTANTFDKMKAGMTATPQASASSFDAMKAGMDRLAAAARAAPATPSQPSPDYAGFESRRAQAYSSLPAAPSPASTPTASISPASIAALGALTAPATASINPTAISATPASLTTPRPSVAPISVTPTAVARVTPPTVAPVTPARVAPRTVSVPAAPARRAAAISAPSPAPTPSFRAADIYSGLAPVGAQGVATGGHTVSRDKYGNISVGNQFGATTTTTPGGRQAADFSGFFGGGFGDFGAPGSLGGLGGRLGKAAPGIIGGMIGNAVAGPVGGILGAMLGNRVAANRAIGLDTYPDAPSPARGNRSSSTGKSRGELSDRARSDIDRGKGGLY